jgi:predicted O-linked N-acetylglucosamine transferase (SPINDLY family)
VANDANVQHHLRKEAVNRGVDAERLVFAPRIAYSEYLARYRLVDLFLDTFPFNAGATASDALWAGLPMITCSGESLASRMAGSLLHAIGMPEMIADSLTNYEELARKLADRPDLIAAARAKLACNRMRYPLFDTNRFTRHFEAALTFVHERRKANLSPDHVRLTA